MEEGLENYKELKKSPIKPGEVFDPEKDSKSKSMTVETEKRFKKWAEKTENVAEMQATLAKIIRQNPDTPFEKLYKYVKDVAPNIGLTDEEEGITKSILEKYINDHKFIQHLKERAMNDKELFESVFKNKPKKLKGKMEIIENPIMLYFRLYDPDDYVRIYGDSLFIDRPLTDKEISVMKSSDAYIIPYIHLIPGLEGFVVIENARGKKFNKAVFDHEEQHVINKFFNYLWQRKGFLNKLNESEMDYLLDWREAFEEDVQNEILAFLKEGIYSPEEIFKILTRSRKEGGAYDYFSNNKKDVLRGLDRKDSLDTVNNIFITEYHKLIKDSLDAFANLEKNGYSRNEAIEILIKKPLIKWPRVVRRLLEAKK